MNQRDKELMYKAIEPEEDWKNSLRKKFVFIDCPYKRNCRSEGWKCNMCINHMRKPDHFIPNETIKMNKPTVYKKVRDANSVIPIIRLKISAERIDNKIQKQLQK